MRTSDDGERLLSMREVCAITSWSRSSINRLIDRGEISRPLKLGRHKIAFRESDIRAYMASLQERPAGARLPEPADPARGAGPSYEPGAGSAPTRSRHARPDSPR